MPEIRPGSAIADLDITVYGGPTSYNEFTMDLTTATDRILDNDPDRLAYWITNEGVDDLFFAATHEVILAHGHILGAGLILIVRARDDGAMTGEDLLMRCAASTASITVSVVKRAHNYRAR